MPYAGQIDGGQRVTDLNIQVSDARSRRGRVRLQSCDPHDQPVIGMGWFLDQSDRAAAKRAEVAQLTMELAREQVLLDALEQLSREQGPKVTA